MLSEFGSLIREIGAHSVKLLAHSLREHFYFGSNFQSCDLAKRY